jgi:putative Mg2+ transporter-C (MgtC) family protein
MILKPAASIWEALGNDFADLLEIDRLAVIALRLVCAALLGGLLGYQRERVGKAAGLRTHMLVCLGAAFFVIVPQMEGMAIDDLSRVIQGIVTGIGFIGAGTILKLTDAREIKGLTTAAGIWLTAAIGIGVGVGRLGSSIVGAVLAFIIMEFLYRLHRLIGNGDNQDA